MIIGIIKFSDGFNMVNTVPSLNFARGWIIGMREKNPSILNNDGITIIGSEIIEVFQVPDPCRVSEN